MSILLNGIKLGVVLAFLIGPVFFTLIQTSIERGFWRGVMVAAGVSISDLVYVLICYFGLVQLIEDPDFRQYMGYVGGGILILFGLYHLLIKSRKSITGAKAASEKKAYRYFIKGFFINAFSPMVPLFWIGTIGVATIDFGYTENGEFFVFFAALLTTVLLTDVLKAFLAGRLRKAITPKIMRWMNIVVGVALLLFGIRLIWISQTGSTQLFSL
jgi:threonine/homoserine/homoserine lactone efflux protein